MSITISKSAAEAVLRQAYEVAQSDEPVPSEWEAFARRTFGMTSKTYTPALGAALLAKATNPTVDPMSIKSAYGPNTYSLRTVGHTILVPLAQEMGFSIRTTKREPLTDQPFFRYDHMSEIDRVRNRPEHDQFVGQIGGLNELSREDAAAALAAFLRVAIEVAATVRSYEVADGARTLDEVLRCTVEYIDEGIDTPRRAQALVAAAFDTIQSDVRSRAINDPSRDLPGDVQAYRDDSPILSVEVRAKPMPATEVEAFVAACRAAGIRRAIVVIFARNHQPLDGAALGDISIEKYDSLLTVIESPAALLSATFGWSGQTLSDCLSRFCEQALVRLHEIEAAQSSLERWVELTAVN